VRPDYKNPPLIKESLAKAAVGFWRTKLDCASYYTQFAICALTKQVYTIQISRNRILRPNRAQFGMRNAGSVAQRRTGGGCDCCAVPRQAASCHATISYTRTLPMLPPIAK
jgi:hypothetical protein